MKIVFQGDSVTDADRDRSNPHDMGEGYPRFASAMIADAFSDISFEFINQGIGGNRSSQLLDRIDTDCIAYDPDIVSFLIGINDVWHRYGNPPVPTTDEEFETHFRAILTAVREKTHAKILIMEPFLLDLPQRDSMRPELDRLISITRRLEAEFADAVLPLNNLFWKAIETQPEPLFYSADGVHPNTEGACFIAEQYLGAVSPLIRELTAED